MKRIFSWTLPILLLASGLTLSSQEMADTAVKLSIQFHDQQIYYAGDDVFLDVTITNDSSSAYRFRLADNRIFSLAFDIRDLGNLALKPSEQYTTVLSENKPVFARDVTILSGENFSFVERLNNYKDLPSGVFVLSAQFFPELLGQSGQATLQSNRLTLTIRPDIRRQNMVEDKVAQQVQEVLQAANLPPDQVVSYTLTALQKSQREAFFLYLDVNSLYQAEPRRGETLRRMSEAQKMDTISAFKDSLWKKPSPSDPISQPPSSWQIEQTTYSQGRGTVIVLQKYNRDNFFTDVKEYTYQLQLQQDVWRIVGVSVTNKGTE